MSKKINDQFGSMRMVLPEQKADILEHNAVRGLVERPSIDEDDFGEMCFRIYDSTQYQYAISVKWFVPKKVRLGVIETAWGAVQKIDTVQKRFKLLSDWDSNWINIEELISVTK